MWRPRSPVLAAASTVVGGGLGPRHWALNATVDKDYDHPSPADHLCELAAAQRLWTATGSASSPPSTSVGPAGPRPTVRRSWPRSAWAGPRGRPRPRRRRTLGAASASGAGTVNLAGLGAGSAGRRGARQRGRHGHRGQGPGPRRAPRPRHRHRVRRRRRLLPTRRRGRALRRPPLARGAPAWPAPSTPRYRGCPGRSGHRGSRLARSRLTASAVVRPSSPRRGGAPGRRRWSCGRRGPRAPRRWWRS